LNRTKQSCLGQEPRHGGASAHHTNLHFHIDRLTFTGLPRINRETVIDAMQQKLSTLATQVPALDWRQLSAPLKIDGGDISFDATSEQIGSHLALQIMRHLARAGIDHDRSS
jgi:hypothetical protein